MISHFLTSLSRWVPGEPPREGTQPSFHDDDSSWHSSSFELARGLEVIEHSAAPSMVFADTRPAFFPSEASSAT